MKKLRILLMIVVLTAGCFFSAAPSRSEIDTKPVPYQGQNTGRFQMFFSPIARMDNYLVDTMNGSVWEGGVGLDGNNMFGRVAVTPAPKSETISAPGRYVIYYSPQARSDCYLLDTLTGRTWAQYQNSRTKEFFFAEITVQGITADTKKLP